MNDLTQLRVWVKINDHTARLFIDSDCTRNYMFSEFTRKAQIFMQKKKESYNLWNFDETLMKYNNELIDQEIWLIHLRLEHHWKKLRLNFMKQSGSDIVLDISWLRMINSMIDWVNETITFLHTETTRLHLILKSSESVKIFVMTANDIRSELKNSSDAQMLWSRKVKSNFAIIKIFKEYQKYKILFEKESDQEALLKHQSWNHEIKLIDDKEFTKQFIYSLSAEKLDALRQYLKENMQKEFIRKLQSSAEYSILFVSKLNESLRLCVDYRALNNIIIKNSYSLSPIFIDVLTKSLDSLWASEQSSFNTNALKMHMLATRWDVCYKLAVSWVCIVD